MTSFSRSFMPELLPIKDIIIDQSIQSRVEINNDVVLDYADSLNEGIEFPPIVVFDTSDGYLLADGFHRIEAHKLAAKRKILADIKEGDRRDALLYGIGANVRHGARLTNADKRKAVTTLLLDNEWSKWSDQEIARVTGFTQPFVSKVRKELVAAGELEKSETRLAKRGDQIYEIKADTAPKRKFDSEAQPDIEETKVSELVTTPSYSVKPISEPVIEIPPDRMLMFSGIKQGNSFELGEHRIFINSIGKAKSKLGEYNNCFWFGDLVAFTKNQQLILEKADVTTILVSEGVDVKPLETINLPYKSGSLVSVAGRGYYLAHFSSYDATMPDLGLSTGDQLLEEMISALTENEHSILIVEPPVNLIRVVLPIVQEMGRVADILTLDQEYAQRELINWEQIYGEDWPVEKLK